MDLKDYLFDGGNEALPFVKLANWFGGGCIWCAFYRVLILALLLAGYVVSGPKGAATVGVIVLAIGAEIFIEAKRAPYPDDWHEQIEREEAERQAVIAERMAPIIAERLAEIQAGKFPPETGSIDG